MFKLDCKIEPFEETVDQSIVLHVMNKEKTEQLKKRLEETKESLEDSIRIVCPEILQTTPENGVGTLQWDDWPEYNLSDTERGQIQSYLNQQPQFRYNDDPFLLRKIERKHRTENGKQSSTHIIANNDEEITTKMSEDDYVNAPMCDLLQKICQIIHSVVHVKFTAQGDNERNDGQKPDITFDVNGYSIGFMEGKVHKVKERSDAKTFFNFSSVTDEAKKRILCEFQKDEDLKKCVVVIFNLYYCGIYQGTREFSDLPINLDWTPIRSLQAMLSIEHNEFVLGSGLLKIISGLHDPTLFGYQPYISLDTMIERSIVQEHENWRFVCDHGQLSRTTTVYANEDTKDVLKLRSNERYNEDSIQNEISILELLHEQKVPSIPELRQKIESSTGFVGLKIYPFSCCVFDSFSALSFEKIEMYTNILNQIITCLLSAYNKCGITHNDLSPEHIRHVDHQLFIIDWGSSTTQNDNNAAHYKCDKRLWSVLNKNDNDSLETKLVYSFKSILYIFCDAIDNWSKQVDDTMENEVIDSIRNQSIKHLLENEEPISSGVLQLTSNEDITSNQLEIWNRFYMSIRGLCIIAHWDISNEQFSDSVNENLIQQLKDCNWDEFSLISVNEQFNGYT